MCLIRVGLICVGLTCVGDAVNTVKSKIGRIGIEDALETFGKGTD